jgi:Heterokaryon incompatibility protein (HET)
MDGRLPGQTASQLSSFGPDQVPSWADLNNIGRLCARCQGVDWEPVKMYIIVADEYTFFPKIPLYSIYPTLGQLRAAAHEGCHLCTLTLTSLLTAKYLSSTVENWMIIFTGVPKINNETVVKVDVEVMAKNPPVWLTIDVDHGGIRSPESWMLVCPPIPIKSEMVQRSQPIQFSSPAEDIARFWLEDCRTRHERCMSETPMLPKRVIDVVSGPEPFLFISQCKRDRYAALSYCFGNYPTLTTTESTLLERQAGMQMATLPKTVRDAVTWTRQLGLQYLWTDSLCILQDNLTDWEVELSTMADIYRDATVTIAATAASHAGSGCGPIRNKLQLAPCMPLPGVVIEANFSRQEWIFEKGPLETRGWTFQETQLSRRVLRCGGQELAWQCRTCKRLEGDPMESRRHDTDGIMKTFLELEPWTM